VISNDIRQPESLTNVNSGSQSESARPASPKISIPPSATPSQNDCLAVLLHQSVRGENPKKFSGNPLDYQEFLLDYRNSTAAVQ